MRAVPTDHPLLNNFRQKVWRYGMQMPHQGKREMERRARQLQRGRA